ncbi:MAG: hypothetical protein V4505_27925 [Pseudomonadota bacterium]
MAARTATLSPRMALLVAVYLLASLAHFAHNAEFIAYYPGLPRGLTREGVYLAWLAITSLGLAGLLVARRGWHTAGVLLIGAYGAFGLDGLAHYTLALCSEHTLVTNATIWAEAGSGLALLLASTLLLVRRSLTPPRYSAPDSPLPARSSTPR